MLAIRLYSGPAYQPINAFLRNVSKVRAQSSRRREDHPRASRKQLEPSTALRERLPPTLRRPSTASHQVHGQFREQLARHASLTFAATTRHIINGIRKLSAVATPEEASPLETLDGHLMGTVLVI